MIVLDGHLIIEFVSLVHTRSVSRSMHFLVANLRTFDIYEISNAGIRVCFEVEERVSFL